MNHEIIKVFSVVWVPCIQLELRALTLGGLFQGGEFSGTLEQFYSTQAYLGFVFSHMNWMYLAEGPWSPRFINILWITVASSLRVAPPIRQALLCLMYIHSFNPHSVPSYWGTEGSSKLPKLTKLVNAGAWIWTQTVICLCALCLLIRNTLCFFLFCFVCFYILN